MKILGIETSCDETAAAIVKDGTVLLSNVVASQQKIHAKFGGVVPEVAARNHIEVMLPVVEKALQQAKIDWPEVGAIAVTAGPGLMGSLLIGTLTAQTLAALKRKRLYPINHVEAHVYGAFIELQTVNRKPKTVDRIPVSEFRFPKFPILALIVSGGHTQLALFKKHGTYQLLGQTHDDAAGEAFDKVAKMLGLPYPGGPAVAGAAAKGNDNAFHFTRPNLGPNSLDFSFSGLKTAVLRQAQALTGHDHTLHSAKLPALLSPMQKNDLAASFQTTVVDILLERLLLAIKKYQPRSVVVAGGVAANQMLRHELQQRLPIKPHIVPLNLCTDNAAMIASLGFFKSQTEKPVQTVSPDPILSM